MAQAMPQTDDFRSGAMRQTLPASALLSIHEQLHRSDLRFKVWK